MTDVHTSTSSAQTTDHDLYEQSPSTGWRETYEVLDATPPDAGEPVEATGCGALGCHHEENLRRVTAGDGRPRVLCPNHIRDFLHRSSEVNA